MDNNIIKILSHLYISNDINNITSEFINKNNVSTIINVDTNDDNTNTNIGINKIFLDGIINFYGTNDIIFQTIKGNNSCIIISNNNIYGFLIVCAFMITYLNISLIESLSLSKKYNININSIDTKYIQDLFDLYKKINN